MKIVIIRNVTTAIYVIQGTTGEHIEAIESAIQSLEKERLKKELKPAEDVEERAVKENPLQFESCYKGYAVGIYNYNALEFVRNGGKEE